jgi:hypothetical protein
MSRTFDTRRDSGGDPLGFWTETVCSQILPVHIDPRQDAQLSSSAMRSTSIGDLQLREVVGGEHLYQRTAGDIRRGDPMTLQVGLQLSGSSLLVQDGREAVLGAGDLVLYDSSRPFSLVMDARFSWQVFLLPKDKLRRSDREISELTATTIDASTGVAGLVVRFLRDLATRADGLELGAAEPELAENAADLVATLVRSQLGRDWRVQDTQRILLDRAMAYVGANLREPHLDPSGSPTRSACRSAPCTSCSPPRGRRSASTCGRSGSPRCGATCRTRACPGCRSVGWRPDTASRTPRCSRSSSGWRRAARPASSGSAPCARTTTRSPRGASSRSVVCVHRCVLCAQKCFTSLSSRRSSVE